LGWAVKRKGNNKGKRIKGGKEKNWYGAELRTRSAPVRSGEGSVPLLIPQQAKIARTKRKAGEKERRLRDLRKQFADGRASSRLRNCEKKGGRKEGGKLWGKAVMPC